MNESTDALGDRKHIGFRVGAALASDISRAVRKNSINDRRLIGDAIRRGLTLMLAEATPTISKAATEAGPAQFRIQLGRDEASQVENLALRLGEVGGRPVPRVFVLRECLCRGLGEGTT